jgi:hypothetical protein
VALSLYANWPQFHSDVCHTGYNASEFILSPANVGKLVLDWKYPTGNDIDLSSPTVANGVVYVGSTGLPDCHRSRLPSEQTDEDQDAKEFAYLMLRLLCPASFVAAHELSPSGQNWTARTG